MFSSYKVGLINFTRDLYNLILVEVFSFLPFINTLTLLRATAISCLLTTVRSLSWYLLSLSRRLVVCTLKVLAPFLEHDWDDCIRFSAHVLIILLKQFLTIDAKFKIWIFLCYLWYSHLCTCCRTSGICLFQWSLYQYHKKGTKDEWSYDGNWFC